MLHFERAIEMASREDVAKAIPCWPDAGPILDSIREAVAIGVDYVYLHQVGDPADGFIHFWRDEIRPELC